MYLKNSRIFVRLFKVCSFSNSALPLQMLVSTKTESSVFTSITNIRPKLSRFMFKMFKAFVPTKVGFTMRGKQLSFEFTISYILIFNGRVRLVKKNETIWSDAIFQVFKYLNPFWKGFNSLDIVRNKTYVIHHRLTLII